MSYTKEDYKTAAKSLYAWVRELVIMCGIVLALITAFGTVFGTFVYCLVHYFPYCLAAMFVVSVFVKFWVVLDNARSDREKEASYRVYPVNEPKQMDLFDDHK